LQRTKIVQLLHERQYKSEPAYLTPLALQTHAFNDAFATWGSEGSRKVPVDVGRFSVVLFNRRKIDQGLVTLTASDLVRLLTISDIYAALIESRPYRPPMSRQAAYKILCDMDGKLERPLVKAFRNVAMGA